MEVTTFYQRKNPDCGKHFESKKSNKKSIKDFAMSSEDIARLLYIRAKKEATDQFAGISSTIPSKFKKIATARLMYVFADKMLIPKDVKKVSGYLDAEIQRKLGADILSEANNDNLHPFMQGKEQPILTLVN